MKRKRQLKSQQTVSESNVEKSSITDKRTEVYTMNAIRESYAGLEDSMSDNMSAKKGSQIENSMIEEKDVEKSKESGSMIVKQEMKDIPIQESVIIADSK